MEPGCDNLIPFKSRGTCAFFFCFFTVLLCQSDKSSAKVKQKFTQTIKR